MIKRLRVTNYLSLKDVDLELRGRNTLVGPNMSGKSNIIDCFKFLVHMALTGLTKAFLDRGGFQEVLWKGGYDDDQISFQLVFHIPGREKDLEKSYEYELVVVGSATGLISVEKESLLVKSGRTTSTLVDLRHGRGRIAHADGSIITEQPLDSSKSVLEYKIPGWEGTIVKDFVSSWRFYRLIPALMKQANAAISQSFLTESGDNLSSWLMTLQSSYPEDFRLLKQTATDVLPGLEEILTPPTQFATTYLTTREKHLKRPITIWRMSDGQLNFLALLSLIFCPLALGSPLYCVEEPENHLQPKMVETLVEVLAQRQQGLGSNAAQIITTTHSPHLVDRLSLDELIVVEKINGATRCTRPSSKTHLVNLLQREDVGLGELWYSGALSGD